ncbi:YhcH/YjgK/YiaL family protein, partial [bacterium]|nr:YhcH/YjgK/YiaL family protein [bacterium]
MIVDDLENISKYADLIPQDVIDFMLKLKSDIKSGRYDIDGINYVNIDEYKPKSIDMCRFEAHRKYIDIQMVLEGQEFIDVRLAEGLNVNQQYDETRDIMFFDSDVKDFDRILLTPYKFV